MTIKRRALFFFVICFFFNFNFIGVQLMYNVVLVSGVQQIDSVIHIHVYIFILF